MPTSRIDHSDGFSAHSLPSFMTYASTDETFCIFLFHFKATHTVPVGRTGKLHCDRRHQIDDFCLRTTPSTERSRSRTGVSCGTREGFVRRATLAVKIAVELPAGDQPIAPNPQEKQRIFKTARAGLRRNFLARRKLISRLPA